MAEGFIGEIKMFGGNFAPRTWAFCEGQLISVSSNNALFAIVGTIYGGDGRTTFGLPDLRGRVPVGVGTGPGLSTRKQGEKSGTETVILSTNQMPSHNHSVTVTANAHDGPGNSNSPVGNVPAQFGNPSIQGYSDEAGSDMSSKAVTVTQTNQGGSQAHNNMQPWLGMRYIICLTGVYPSRS